MNSENVNLFSKLDIRVGKIIKAEIFEQAIGLSNNGATVCYIYSGESRGTETIAITGNMKNHDNANKKENKT